MKVIQQCDIPYCLDNDVAAVSVTGEKCDAMNC